MLNSRRVLTVMAINQTSLALHRVLARGIDLSRLYTLPLAYVEFWTEAPSPDLELALQNMANHEAHRPLVLPSSQLIALSNLNALICWKMEERNHNMKALKVCGSEYDSMRLRIHNFEESDYRLLCLTKGSMEPEFEHMRSAWDEHISAKMHSKQKLIGFDRSGNEVEIEAATSRITWAPKALRFERNVEESLPPMV